MDALIIFCVLLFWLFFSLTLRHYNRYLDEKRGLISHIAVTVQDGYLGTSRKRKKNSKLTEKIFTYSDDFADLGKRINFFSENKEIEDLLRRAGRPYNFTLDRFQGLKIWLAVTLFFASLIFLILGFPLAQFGPILLPVFGFLAPVFWLKQAAKKRQEELRQDLPDFLDTVSTSLQAGVSLDQTLREVIRYFDGPLHEEFSRFNHEIELGVPRELAYRGLLERNDNKEFQGLIKSLIQGLKLGVPIATTFKVQAEDMRQFREEKIKELAAKASPKVTLVTTFVVAPVSLLIIAGLMILNMIYGDNSLGSLFQ